MGDIVSPVAQFAEIGGPASMRGAPPCRSPIWCSIALHQIVGSDDAVGLATGPA